MSDPSNTPPLDEPVDPTSVDPEEGTDPSGTPVENPSG